MKKILCSILTLVFCWMMSPISNGQEINGYILSIESGKVFIDLNAEKVHKGDVLKVVKTGEIMIHPVTGEKIQKKDEIVANISITEVFDSYSVGDVYPKDVIDMLKPGMKVFPMKANEVDRSLIKKSVILPPFIIVGGKIGELGAYMADLMTEELFQLDRFRIMDRQTFDIQQFEKQLQENSKQIILPGNEGVDYLVTGSAYPPDVVEKATGLPLKALVTAAGGAVVGNVVKNMVPDLKIKELEAVVKFTLKVIDVRTGEVLFICSEMAKAEGKTQVSLESSVLGGLVLNGGATDFRNTLTGQASQIALSNAAGYIADFFEGKITDKSFQGNVIELKRNRNEDRQAGLLDIQNLSGQLTALVNAGSDEGIKNGYYYLVTMPNVVVSGITGKEKVFGVQKAGIIKTQQVEFDAAAGSLKLLPFYQSLHNEVISEGKLLPYKPFRLTLSTSVYGIWGDVLMDLDLGAEYFPNLPGWKKVNNKLWLGVRVVGGLHAAPKVGGGFDYLDDFGAEVLLGLNPFRKSFHFNGFDPYFGFKYKFFKVVPADSGPAFFAGTTFYGFFTELAINYGLHADVQYMSDPTFSTDRVAFGFAGLGMHFGYRFIINRLVI